MQAMLAAAAPSDGRLPAAGAGEGTAATGLGLLGYCAPVRWRGWDGQTPLMARGRRTTSGRYLFTASGPPCSLLVALGSASAIDGCALQGHGHVIYYSVLCTTPCTSPSEAKQRPMQVEPAAAGNLTGLHTARSFVHLSLSLAGRLVRYSSMHAWISLSCRRSTEFIDWCPRSRDRLADLNYYYVINDVFLCGLSFFPVAGM